MEKLLNEKVLIKVQPYKKPYSMFRKAILEFMKIFLTK